MDGDDISCDKVIAELIEMGFEYSVVIEAIKEVGPSLDNAVEFILNGSSRNNKGASTSSNCLTSYRKFSGKRTLASTHSLGKTRQSSLSEHLQSTGRTKQSRSNGVADVYFSGQAGLPEPVGEQKEPLSNMDCKLKTSSESSIMPVYCPQELGIGVDWEQKVNRLLLKHFGYSSIKSFQKEALAAWLANQDCLVLAAKGAGKSMCFQIPALLTGKVVIVISPLISGDFTLDYPSIMHDQCLKLAKHGVSACFLGSGQPDSSVEQKAMSGMYGIIYVGPDTILRLIQPLQRLAETRGIALFAIDEVHCVSECGHSFRIVYRRLSILRENFSACNLKFLKFDIPFMALTSAAAAATSHVREDILESLCMSKETKIVVTSFFRPNLRFSVKSSRTVSSSYEEDFSELIDTYSKKKVSGKKKRDIISKDADDASDDSSSTANSSISEADRMYASEVDSNEDVACGEFYGQYPAEDGDICLSTTTTIDPPIKPEERLRLLRGPLEHGPSIIYVPTRKKTSSIAKYLRSRGVKAAAYHAGLRKSRLRQVHEEFHDNTLEVVVATIAFGIGIDKLNVRRIIHYGWPQSLEAYYQQAGRAGRDGKLADCVLYVPSRIPTLLPSLIRSRDQEIQAHKRLSDCFRYGMNTSSCRAKTLVEYFGEDFSYEKCLLCDVCVNGPPEMQNLKMEADAFMQVIAAHYESVMDNEQWRYIDIRMFVSRIREQFQKFKANDHLWWRGLARLLEDKGYIRERYHTDHVQIEFPEPTVQGLEFMHSDQTFYVYPETDMLRKSTKKKSDLKPVRGRLSAKLSKQKQRDIHKKNI